MKMNFQLYSLQVQRKMEQRVQKAVDMVLGMHSMPKILFRRCEKFP